MSIVCVTKSPSGEKSEDRDSKCEIRVRLSFGGGACLGFAFRWGRRDSGPARTLKWERCFSSGILLDTSLLMSSMKQKSMMFDRKETLKQKKKASLPFSHVPFAELLQM